MLRVSVRPTLNAEVLRTLGFAIDESAKVEGFWVPRPWLLEAACPAASPRDAEESASRAGDGGPIPPLVGIAQLDDDGRAQSIVRDGRAYEITRKLPEETSPEPIDLVLEGRLQSLRGGKVVTCIGEATRRPPTCIVSVDLDKVRLEQPGGERLAEWSEA